MVSCIGMVHSLRWIVFALIVCTGHQVLCLGNDVVCIRPLTHHTGGGVIYNQDDHCLDMRSKVILNLQSDCKQKNPISMSACANRTAFMTNHVQDCNEGTRVSRDSSQSSRATGRQRPPFAKGPKTKRRWRWGAMRPGSKSKAASARQTGTRQKSPNFQRFAKRPAKGWKSGAKGKSKKGKRPGQGGKSKKGKRPGQGGKSKKGKRPGQGKTGSGPRRRPGNARRTGQPDNQKNVQRPEARRRPSNSRQEGHQQKPLHNCCSDDADKELCDSKEASAKDGCHITKPSDSPLACAHVCFFNHDDICEVLYDSCVQGDSCICTHLMMACQGQCGQKSDHCVQYLANYVYPYIFT